MSEDDDDVLDRLHLRMLEGDPTASVDLFTHYAAPLVRYLAAKFPTTDSDLVHDAVVTALLDYAERPERFKPEKRSLKGYLTMAAHGDLLNLLEKSQRRDKHETPVDSVELEAVARNIEMEVEVIDHDAASALVKQAMAIAETDEERIVLQLMLNDESATEVYAHALGLSDLTPTAKRQRIYTVKERLTKRLRRLPRPTGGEQS